MATQNTTRSAAATKAAATRKANAERATRLAAVKAAVSDEMARFDAVIGKLPISQRPLLQTAFGPYRTVAVHGDFDFHGVRDEVAQVRFTRKDDQPSSFDMRWFMLANDGRWADLLEQAGVARHPLFQ